MNYYFGFSLKGLIVFLLPMLPNIFYFLLPDSQTKGNSHLILDIMEHGSQGIFIFMLIFLIRKQASELVSPYTIGMGIVLVSYYVMWILCFTGKANFVLLLGMAVLPVIYFILAELWLYNYPAIIPTLLFGIVHVIITYMDFRVK